MKSASLPATRSLSPVQPKLQQMLEAWRDLIEQCVDKPSAKRVHGLRSATQRLEAALMFFLRRPLHDPAAVKTVLRWTRMSKKLRRALRPVRDTDVYLGRIGDLARPRRSNSAQPELSARRQREAAKVERALERRRKASVKQLEHVLKARHKEWDRLGKQVQATLTETALGTGTTPAQSAFDQFAALTAQFPELDSANLHAYRKHLKHALYLVELTPADPVARRLRAAFRKIHDAAGEWHDWHALTMEAACVMGDKARAGGLIPTLEARAEAALQHALDECRSAAQQFLKV